MRGFSQNKRVVSESGGGEQGEEEEHEVQEMRVGEWGQGPLARG